MNFSSKLEHYQVRLNRALEDWLPGEDIQPTTLHRAIRYAVLGDGKRIRPALVYASGEAVGVPIDRLDAAACAVELIHAYSLIHDDLPAMDDDDLRRGRPTCHKAFDEATAILAGDAIQAFAFELLSDHGPATLSAAQRIEMISALATASGSRGMAGGQAIDLESVGRELNIAELENMHIHKTGALILASVRLGALAAGTIRLELMASLEHYAKCIGLAFQVQDDILDVEGDTEVIGKPSGSDEARNKPTYPNLLGLAGAKQVALELHEDAINTLEQLGQEADTLRQLADYIVKRTK